MRFTVLADTMHGLQTDPEAVGVGFYPDLNDETHEGTSNVGSRPFTTALSNRYRNTQ